MPGDRSSRPGRRGHSRSSGSSGLPNTQQTPEIVLQLDQDCALLIFGKSKAQPRMVWLFTWRECLEGFGAQRMQAFVEGGRAGKS